MDRRPVPAAQHLARHRLAVRGRNNISLDLHGVAPVATSQRAEQRDGGAGRIVLQLLIKVMGHLDDRRQLGMQVGVGVVSLRPPVVR